MRTNYLALVSGRPGWRDPKPEGLTLSSAIREGGPWLGCVWLRQRELGPSPRAPCWAPNVRTPWQDKESAGVLRSFIGQPLPAELPSTSGGKRESATCRKWGRHFYTLAEAEVAGPFHIWLESGSRVLIGLFSLMSVFDWPESWRLRVHQFA